MVARNHRTFLKKKETIINFRYDHDRLFCGLCDEVGRNFGYTPVGMFNHLRESCGALDKETRRLYLLGCHAAREKAQRRLCESILDELNPIEDDEGPLPIYDEPTEEMNTENDVFMADQISIAVGGTEETNTDNDGITADQISIAVGTEETTRDNNNQRITRSLRNGAKNHNNNQRITRSLRNKM